MQDRILQIKAAPENPGRMFITFNSLLNRNILAVSSLVSHLIYSMQSFMKDASHLHQNLQPFYITHTYCFIIYQASLCQFYL